MTILVCQCGARLNAPGATPGRCWQVSRLAAPLYELPEVVRSPRPRLTRHQRPTNLMTVPPRSSSPPRTRRRKSAKSKPTFVDKLDAWNRSLLRSSRSTRGGTMEKPVVSVLGRERPPFSHYLLHFSGGSSRSYYSASCWTWGCALAVQLRDCLHPCCLDTCLSSATPFFTLVMC